MAKQTQTIRRQIADKLFECLTSSQQSGKSNKKQLFDWIQSLAKSSMEIPLQKLTNSISFTKHPKHLFNSEALRCAIY